jgi:hypothetical protein
MLTMQAVIRAAEQERPREFRERLEHVGRVLNQFILMGGHDALDTPKAAGFRDRIEFRQHAISGDYPMDIPDQFGERLLLFEQAAVVQQLPFGVAKTIALREEEVWLDAIDAVAEQERQREAEYARKREAEQARMHPTRRGRWLGR